MTDKRWIKRLLSALACSLVLLACSPKTPTPDPLDLIRDFEAAMNRGDTDAALDLFVDKELTVIANGGYAEDKETLRYYLDHYAGMANPEDQFQDCQPEGEGVTCVWSRHDGVCLEALGIGVEHFRVTFLFQDHKIRSMVGWRVLDEVTAYAEASGKMYTWADANIPEKMWKFTAFVVRLGPPSGWEWAELELEICRDYMEAASE